MGRPEYGSDLIVELLRAFNIDYVALNPGSSFRGLHDSIVNYGGNERPELIQVCHEEVAVAIAHGYAKAKGRPMAVILHDVVGLQHASMAIFNAWCDRVPIMILGGTGPMDITRRRPWIDWVHTALVQGNLIRDFVKWDDQPASIAAFPDSFIRGYRIATTEPKGPVYICFDAEHQEARLEEIPPVDISRYPSPSPIQAEEGALKRAVELLIGAERPVLIAEYTGRNPSACPHLIELAELLAIPVIDLGGEHAGRFNFPNTHPLDLTGAEELLAECDLILALDVQDLYGALSKAPSAKVIDISLRDLGIRSWAADYQRLPEVDLRIIADTSVALSALVKIAREMGRGPKQGRWEAIENRHEELLRRFKEEARRRWDETPISLPRLAQEVWEAVRGKDWCLAHGGLNGWVRRLWEIKEPYQFLGGSGGGGLGYGLGASIGAALAHRGEGKLIIDLQPDGDLLYTPSALWTAAHHQLPILIVVFNNRSYYNDEVHQELMAKVRGRPVERKGIGIRLEEPPVDFTSLARGFGLYGEGPIEKPEELAPALRRALKVIKEEGKAALIDVIAQLR